MNDESEAKPPEEMKRSPVLALVLAFLPSVMFLALTGGPHQTFTMMLACAASVVCCYTASILLFRRKTSLSILAGVILLLLNLAISFLFGCSAAFNRL